MPPSWLCPPAKGRRRSQPARRSRRRGAAWRRAAAPPGLRPGAAAVSILLAPSPTLLHAWTTWQQAGTSAAAERSTGSGCDGCTGAGDYRHPEEGLVVRDGGVEAAGVDREGEQVAVLVGAGAQEPDHCGRADAQQAAAAAVQAVGWLMGWPKPSGGSSVDM